MPAERHSLAACARADCVSRPLTDPTAHGGTAEDAFHLVLPSLPGYGFSGEPIEVGWDLGRTARRDRER